MDAMNLKKPAGQSAFEYKQALWKKSLCCSPAYGKYCLNGKCLERLKQWT